MTDYKAQLDMLLAMPKLERKVYLIQQSVKSEQAWLDELLLGWKQDRSFSLQDIREQRRRVQAWRKRLEEAKRKQTESEQNKTPSE